MREYIKQLRRFRSPLSQRVSEGEGEKTDACRGRTGTLEVYPKFQICLDRFTHKLTLDFLGA